MNHETAINKIKTFERFGSRLGLERMRILMELLGNPQKDLNVIHVAGTNGKGSVCRYLYEALSANDYKVGLYTSPFLEVFNERIEYNGALISDEELEQCTDHVLQKVQLMLEQGMDSPTEFEIVTAVAFVYFKKLQADYVVLEVGLGGIGDSTNIVENPLACVITSISYDHMDRLGDTIEKIAAEKAGIIKQGVPVIMNVTRREAAKVIARKAYETNAVLVDATKIKYKVFEQSMEGYTLDTRIFGTEYTDVQIRMIGEHQLSNVMTALITLELLRKQQKIKVERSRLYAGLKRAIQIGRFEVMEKNPYIILDGAHNEDGAKALAETVKSFLSDKKILMVIGMLEDKDYNKILDQFTQVTDCFVVTEPNNPRKLKTEILYKLLTERGQNCTVIEDPAEAYQYAESIKEQYEVVLYAGSLYLVGQIRRILRDDGRKRIESSTVL
ncbi:bifunctional folylpolyglutamate synthase/dihydrofolate synthase [Clostridium aminobutyricum]|uniref:tetrahydrofolate synthase n=1 Tax=Clostridium aminobutyricum TaxID=33953 RepID=A0A939IGH3_CLOAM|nr:folylpolyglutamate synthase/dihydrofolate synthase family protein [Clostridium aminobutyricum]MBN7771912.1 bifunctional folylpolyglutamate synthase/dihydrofolate synthase [Clostridium aminobutyricum]